MSVPSTTISMTMVVPSWVASSPADVRLSVMAGVGEHKICDEMQKIHFHREINVSAGAESLAKLKDLG